jgi:hypothetical protein
LLAWLQLPCLNWQRCQAVHHASGYQKAAREAMDCC